MTANTALILAGGGARAAYQAGALMAIARMRPKGAPSPFGIICGTSAGAINATALAAGAHNFRRASAYLSSVWRELHVSDVYRSELSYFLKTFMQLGASVVSGGRLVGSPQSLLDNAPLRDLLERVMDFRGVEGAIDGGALKALALTASCYNSGLSVTFFEGGGDIEGWQRSQRIGVRARLTIEHLMASASIPVLFPSVQVDNLYYCDGAIRQMAPMSPALHLGADKVFAINLISHRQEVPAGRRPALEYPTLAQVFGHLLNSIFLDSMAVDMERLIRINHTVSLLSEEAKLENKTSLKRVEVFTLSPSRSLEEIAYKHAESFPRVLRFLMRGAGAMRQRGATLASYLLFEPAYCKALIDLGYRDAMEQKQAILAFLDGETAR
ncbi:patatin-like phospholipase family protein [Crenobacter cavernae]|uniref:Patatin-like phospholipase family protein n=1 Tax=Crenobacter cavernae TaxID=2290923 RepID=A0A345Y8G6_9NEIS|nr:patatin-like phospholipase family protein [Crenobacter cavernae]AXK40218.1 patatin-like phospholipase family protein [Crenobacter cavernae]